MESAVVVADPTVVGADRRVVVVAITGIVIDHAVFVADTEVGVAGRPAWRFAG